MGAKKDPKKDSKTPAKNPKKKEGGGGGKAKKKKWSKGKSRDKLNNLVLFDKNTYDKLYKEVPSYKLITPSIVSERLKVKCGIYCPQIRLTKCSEFCRLEDPLLRKLLMKCLRKD